MKKVLGLGILVLSLFAGSNSLVSDMCKGIDYYRIEDCPMELVQEAITKGVGKIEKDEENRPISFAIADAFNNKNKIYSIYLKFDSRLSKDSGLFVDDKKRFVYIENLPENVRFYPGGEYIGFVKGEGAYKIEVPLTNSLFEMIPKGKVIVIKRETKIHWK